MPKPITSIDPKVEPNRPPSKDKRRQFTLEYKLWFIQQADACEQGEMGELYRREGVYSSLLSKWRMELARKGIDGLRKTTPGPTPKKTAEEKRIEELERENARLRRQLKVKDSCLLLQKKALALLENLEEDES